MTPKRILDLVLALLLLVPAAMLCVVFAIIIWLECRANPIFRQVRLGKDKVPFALYKLRTMAPATRQGTSHEVGSATILRCGSLLRRLKIDELPQIWNILKGEMSFIGPRPGLPQDAALTAARDAHGVFSLLPGISGPAQLAGLDMSTPVELANADAAYLSDWSLGRDLSIMVQTAGGRGFWDASNTSTPGRKS
ncbi:MAG: sugar transferase [Sphingopyxis sp.]|nr:sugar transferase [Sphingopyxis sp.]